ncbi:MAG: MBL fold metallo-hydrolase, partial [Candidatus Omnitrophica bacterium]|nr:MBL fold metallo-hydrolase [Candidatus Omnitrophota bacterium]
DVLKGDRPHILVDPGHVGNELGQKCLEHLIDSLKSDGISPQQLGIIIDTHTHIDHYEANQALVEKSRKAVQGKTDQAMIALHKDADIYRKTTGARWAAILGRNSDFTASFYIKEGALDLGQNSKVDLEIIETPGHAPGEVCIYWPAKKVLITGDIIFVGGLGRTDLPGGDGNQLKESIERLSKYDVEYLLTGHEAGYGSILTGKDKIAQNFNFLRANYYPWL